MELSQATKMYFYSLDLSEASEKWYRMALGRFTDWLGKHECRTHPTTVTEVEQIDTNHMREYTDWLRGQTFERKTYMRTAKKPMGGHTLHGYCRVMRAYLNWCIKEDLLSEVVTKRYRMPKREKRVIAVFSDSQVMRLMEACEGHYSQQYAWMEERDKALLYVLVDTGMRRQEAMKLRLEDVHFGKEDAYVLVNGKGRAQREIGIGNAARMQLFRYVHRYRPNTVSDHVFLSRYGRQMNTKGIDEIIWRIRERVAFQGVRVSAHTFRHTFAYNYLNNGGDVMKLSLLLGHSSLTVTEGYLSAFKSREARKGSSVLDEMLDRRHQK